MSPSPPYNPYIASQSVLKGVSQRPEEKYEEHIMNPFLRGDDFQGISPVYDPSVTNPISPAPVLDGVSQRGYRYISENTPEENDEEYIMNPFLRGNDNPRISPVYNPSARNGSVTQDRLVEDNVPTQQEETVINSAFVYPWCQLHNNFHTDLEIDGRSWYSVSHYVYYHIVFCHSDLRLTIPNIYQTAKAVETAEIAYNECVSILLGTSLMEIYSELVANSPVFKENILLYMDVPIFYVSERQFYGCSPELITKYIENNNFPPIQTIFERKKKRGIEKESESVIVDPVYEEMLTEFVETEMPVEREGVKVGEKKLVVGRNVQDTKPSISKKEKATKVINTGLLGNNLVGKVLMQLRERLFKTLSKEEQNKVLANRRDKKFMFVGPRHLLDYISSAMDENMMNESAFMDEDTPYEPNSEHRDKNKKWVLELPLNLKHRDITVRREFYSVFEYMFYQFYATMLNATGKDTDIAYALSSSIRNRQGSNEERLRGFIQGYVDVESEYLSWSVSKYLRIALNVKFDGTRAHLTRLLKTATENLQYQSFGFLSAYMNKYSTEMLRTLRVKKIFGVNRMVVNRPYPVYDYRYVYEKLNNDRENGVENPLGFFIFGKLRGVVRTILLLQDYFSHGGFTETVMSEILDYFYRPCNISYLRENTVAEAYTQSFVETLDNYVNRVVSEELIVELDRDGNQFRRTVSGKLWKTFTSEYKANSNIYSIWTYITVNLHDFSFQSKVGKSVLGDADNTQMAEYLGQLVAHYPEQMSSYEIYVVLRKLMYGIYLVGKIFGILATDFGNKELMLVQHLLGIRPAYEVTDENEITSIKYKNVSIPLNTGFQNVISSDLQSIFHYKKKTLAKAVSVRVNKLIAVIHHDFNSYPMQIKSRFFFYS